MAGFVHDHVLPKIWLKQPSIFRVYNNKLICIYLQINMNLFMSNNMCDNGPVGDLKKCNTRSCKVQN